MHTKVNGKMMGYEIPLLSSYGVIMVQAVVGIMPHIVHGAKHFQELTRDIELSKHNFLKYISVLSNAKADDIGPKEIYMHTRS